MRVLPTVNQGQLLLLGNMLSLIAEICYLTCTGASAS